MSQGCVLPSTRVDIADALHMAHLVRQGDMCGGQQAVVVKCDEAGVGADLQDVALDPPQLERAAQLVSVRHAFINDYRAKTYV